MEQFNLEKWLQDNSHKVVTRDGRPVRILCIDCGVKKSQPILVEITCGGNTKVLEYYNINGTTQDKNLNLFFADKEEELTELQKTLEEDFDCYVNLYNGGNTREELREWIKCWCHRIIYLAKKELEKSNPYNGNQKQEWSEEDEKKRKGIIKGLEDKMGFGWASDPFSREEYIDWLKSLKPNHWKPSEEQMEALFEAKLASINNREYFLGLLYEDLKKL